MLRVAVIGTGYVGLVTGTCLSDLGHDVVCVDTDETKIARLKAGGVPIYEPGLEKLVAENMARGQLRFTADIHEGMAQGVDVLFIAVGTPTEEDGRGANLDYVFAAVEEVARALASQPGGRDELSVIVIKSTVPVGTSQKVSAILSEHLPSERFAVASNPEFLREGNAIEDFMEPDRIVVGSRSERARQILEDLYLPLTRKGRPLVVTSTVETAELTKYAANAFLATKVTFINEIARLCEAVGADVRELALGLGLDHRIGDKFLVPGPGFGGSCFPKDLSALVKTAGDFGSPVEVVETVIRANDHHKQMMVRKIRDALGGSVKDRKIAVLGLTFKANTDDMRDAPSLTIVPPLIAEGAGVRGYDPASGDQVLAQLPGLALAKSIEEALDGVDAAVVLTEWRVFRAIPWGDVGPRMRRRLIVDLRNIYETEDLLRHDFEHIPLGRQEPKPGLRAAAE